MHTHGHDLHVGDVAPAFHLKDQSGRLVNLQEYQGKQGVVLIFYPGDLTPGCTIQLCSLRDEWGKFKDMQIAVLGINHAEAGSHQQFVKKHTLPMPLLVDRSKNVSRAYGAIRSLFGVRLIRRRVVGIDKQGMIRYIKNGMPKNADILKAMKPYV